MSYLVKYLPVLLFLLASSVFSTFAVEGKFENNSDDPFDDDTSEIPETDNPFADDAEETPDADDPFADDTNAPSENDDPFAETDSNNPFENDGNDDPFSNNIDATEKAEPENTNDPKFNSEDYVRKNELLGFLPADKLIWRGYFENQLQGTDFNDFWLLDYNKLRLEMSATTKADETSQYFADLNIAVIGQTYHGRTMLNLLDFIPDSAKNEIPPGTDENLYVFAFEDFFKLEVGEVVLNFSRLQVKLGKILLKTGTGYFFNPTDIFMQKSAIDPSYETAGVPAMTAEYFLEFDPPVSAGALITYDEDFQYSTKVAFLKFYTRFADEITADTRIQAAFRKEKHTTDYFTFETEDLQRYQIGWDTHMNLFGLGFGWEIALNMYDHARSWVAGVAQVDYVFENGITALAEYYFDDSGKNGHENYQIHDWTELMFGARSTLGRHYVNIALSYQASLIFAFDVAGLVNISDGSSIVIPRINISVNESVSMNIYGVVGIGSKNSEYGSQDSSIILRFRYSFTSEK